MFKACAASDFLLPAVRHFGGEEEEEEQGLGQVEKDFFSSIKRIPLTMRLGFLLSNFIKMRENKREG